MDILTTTFVDGDFVAVGKLEYARYIWRVPDLPAALDLANRFGRTGRYKYFRGQKDASWQMTSTFERASEERRAQAIKDLSDFAAFVETSPELLPYLQTPEAVIATAQHHGITPTTFIDFTVKPEVAAWFASEGVTGETEGCIFLIDDDAEARINQIGARYGTKIFSFDVANLWRLQAQHGLFLEATVSIDQLWPLDRIIFDHTGKTSPIKSSHIYPEKRSHLEQAIDQYKVLRERRETWNKLLEMEGIFHFDVSDKNPRDIEGIIAIPGWDVGPDERWANIDIDSSPPEIDIQTLHDTAAVEAIIVARRRCAELLVVKAATEQSASVLQSHIDRFWEGSRPFPYTDAQLARGVHSVVYTWQVLRNFDLHSGSDQAAAAFELLGDSVEIEMATAGRNTARAYIGKDRLLTALKLETRQRLGDTPQTAIDIMLALAEDYRTPARNFEPDALIDLFVDQVIPWQIVTNRDPVAYSPFHILTLGIA